MIEHLPYGRFEWVEVNWENIDFVLNKSDNSSRGYFLEVDLECPVEFHNDQKDLPATPEKIRITELVILKN